MKLRTFLDDTLSSKGSVKVSLDIVDKYRDRYKKVLDRGLKFKTKIYRTKIDTVFVHIKVPSETVNGFYYDVLIELIPNGASDYDECEVKFFSNSPSFVFTSAYVFYHTIDEERSVGNIKSRLLITGTESKLPSEVIKKKPEVRNPYGLPIFDKTIFYAVSYMIDTVPYSSLMRNTNIFPKNRILANILSYSQLDIARNKQIILNKDKKKNEKSKKKSTISSMENKVRSVNKTGKKSDNMIKKVRSVNKVKPIKSIKKK